MCEITILGQIYHSFGQKRCENDLIEDMKRMYESGLNSDVVIIASDREFKAHKAVLMARSQFFNKEFNQKQTNMFEVADIEPNVMQSVLRFIYTGTTEPSDDQNWVQLLEAADKLCLNGLKTICSQRLYSDINDSNAIKALVLSESLNDRKLKKRSISYVKNNIKNLVNSEDWNRLIRSNPELMQKLLLA